MRRCAKSIAPFGVEGSLKFMPSIITTTWLELAPRTNTEVCVPGPPDCCTDTPGTQRSTSSRVRNCRRSISSRVMTVTVPVTFSAGIGFVGRW